LAYYRRPPRRKPSTSSGVVLIYLIISTGILFSLFNILGSFGNVVKNIVLGVFGVSAYALCIFSILVSIKKLINWRLVIDRRKAAKFLPLIFLGIMALHIMTTRNYISADYGDYLKQCYTNGNINAGGVVLGSVLYPFMSWLGVNFALAIIVIAFFSAAFISLYPLFLGYGNFKTKSVRYAKAKKDVYDEEESEPSDIRVGNELFIGSPDGKSSNNRIQRKSPFSSNKTKDFDLSFPNKIDVDSETVDNPLIDKIKNKGSYDILFANPYDKEEVPVKVSKPAAGAEAPHSLIFPTVSNEVKPSAAEKPKPIVSANDQYANYTLGYRQAQIKKSLEEGVEIKSTYDTQKRLGIFDENTVDKKDLKDSLIKSPEEQLRFEKAKKRLYGSEEDEKEPDKTFESLFINNRTEIPRKTIFDNIDENKTSSYDILYGNKTEPYNLPTESLEKNIFKKNSNAEREEQQIKEFLQDELIDKRTENIEEESIEYHEEDYEPFSELPSDASARALRSDIGRSHNTFPRKSEKNEIIDVKVEAKQVSMTDSPTAVFKKTRYVAPPEELLKMYPRVESDSVDEHQERCIALRNVLLEYGIDTVVDRYTVGPSFTRYEITMPIGVTVKRIQQISDDIAMRLKANKIRIEAPIPGKNAVGVEIPNSKPSTVGLREGIRSSAFKKDSELSFLLGMNLSGEVFTCNIVKMPHLLIAGATGSGKSVCINCLICSLLYKYSPDQVRLILIDPKRVELSLYNGLPHLLVPDIIFDAEKAINAMNWATKEMERRYELFHSMRVRNLEEHNRKAEAEGAPFLPYIVFIIDELADLMTYKKREIEEKIKRLAQLARAAGIHLIFATQRPSVDIITGTIKANFPSRIAFAVTSFADSKTILDHGGADKLRGQGDMLYNPVGSPDPIRLQGAFITNDEVEAITDFVKENNTSYYDESIEAEIDAVKSSKADDAVEGEENGDVSDEFFIPALKMIIETGQASISMIQRRFAVGYARAARLIDEMEARGYVGPSDGSKPRDVKITLNEFISLYGDIR